MQRKMTLNYAACFFKKNSVVIILKLVFTGSFSFHELMAYQPVLGGFYFVLFMSSCYMILMNVFMTILNDSIADSGEEEEVSSQHLL